MIREILSNYKKISRLKRLDLLSTKKNTHPVLFITEENKVEVMST